MNNFYVIIRNDLHRSQKTVQSVHATAEFLLHEDNFIWDNGTVVCLQVEDEKELLCIENKIKDHKIPYRTFREPYTGNDMTAIALVGRKDLFRELTLA